MTVSVRVDIVSDIVCPWCLIGWERLKRALALLDGEIDVEVHWLPFELNPDMPAAGVDRQAYLEAKFGPIRAKEVTDRLASAAAADKIEMRFERVARQPNTLAAHQLIHWADETGAGSAIKEALFHAHFVAGRFIGDPETLIDIAGEVGLDRATARQILATDAHAHAVRALEEQAREIGIQGVPFFIFDQKLALSGAQSPEVLIDALRQALSLRKAA